MKSLLGYIRILCIGCLPLAPIVAQTQNPILGMNASMGSLTADQQNIILGDLHTAGVHFIRAGITPDNKGVDFARRAQAQGISILWLVQLQYRADAPSRPWPNQYNVWGGPPLSAADPVWFRSYFEPMLSNLDAAGVTLAGFELGNEINSPMFNADFSLPAEIPGQSKEFNLGDLYHDPEAQQVAKGYLQYLKLLAVIRDVRYHSKINQHTPIVSAGLVYNDPGVPAAVAGRRDRLAKYVLAQCQPEGSAGGKPCWITEWGIPNGDTACPVNEANQVVLVNEMRANFRPYLLQRRVLALFYYAWIDSREGFGVYRCNGVTQTGQLAVERF